MKQLAYDEAGSGPLLLLLHGFPDLRSVWRAQLEHLSRFFHVLVPDLRGYGASARPPGVDQYQMSYLVDDVLQLMGQRRAFLAGHDWGGAIAWNLAARRPDLVQRLAVLNSPHPAAFSRHLLTNPAQMARSWYLFFFQLPWLPEQVILRDTRRWLRSFHTGPVDYLNEVAENLAHPGAASAALNYYRAARRGSSCVKTNLSMPTLILWGLKDPALGKRLAWDSAPHVNGPCQVHLWKDAGHWVQLDQPERTNSLLHSFFGGL